MRKWEIRNQKKEGFPEKKGSGGSLSREEAGEGWKGEILPQWVNEGGKG